MRRSIIICAAVVLSGPAVSQEAVWTRLNAAQITAALTDRSIAYEAASQEFRASGRTLYISGQESWGYWAVRGDQYCSSWPPSDLWACYDIEMRTDSLRFIGPAGDVIQGRLSN